MTSTGAGWAQLRQQARQLETQTDSLFHTYSQFASATTVPPKATEEETKTEQDLNDILQKRDTTLASLTRLLDSEAHSSSALKASHLARHRETLAQHRADLSRLKSQLSTNRDRSNLLSSVRSDINAYHAANPASAEAEYMLDERARIDNSHNMTDSVLSQAYAVNESFRMQTEQLERVRRRIGHAFGTVPGINGLINRIGNKRRRDGIILGSFIAFCCLALLYFM